MRAEGNSDLQNMTAESAGNWILERTPSHFQVGSESRASHARKSDNNFKKMIASNYSYGIERDEEKLKENNLDHRKWTNPLEIQ